MSRSQTGLTACAALFSIACGRGPPADTVFLDRNLLAIPAESLASARVSLTMSAGRVVFRRP